MPENNGSNENKKKVYIRPEDVVELVKEVMKKCSNLDELKEHLNKMNWYLKHEKFDKLREVFDIDP